MTFLTCIFLSWDAQNYGLEKSVFTDTIIKIKPALKDFSTNNYQRTNFLTFFYIDSNDQVEKNFGRSSQF